jgi:hypothetical protein
VFGNFVIDLMMVWWAALPFGVKKAEDSLSSTSFETVTGLGV